MYITVEQQEYNTNHNFLTEPIENASIPTCQIIEKYREMFHIPPSTTSTVQGNVEQSRGTIHPIMLLHRDRHIHSFILHYVHF